MVLGRFPYPHCATKEAFVITFFPIMKWWHREVKWFAQGHILSGEHQTRRPDFFVPSWDTFVSSNRACSEEAFLGCHRVFSYCGDCAIESGQKLSQSFVCVLGADWLLVIFLNSESQELRWVWPLWKSRTMFRKTITSRVTRTFLLLWSSPVHKWLAKFFCLFGSGLFFFFFF